VPIILKDAIRIVKKILHDLEEKERIM